MPWYSTIYLYEEAQAKAQAEAEANMVQAASPAASSYHTVVTGLIEHISPTEAAQRHAEHPETIVLLDCREHVELQLAKIDGATHIPMGEIPDRFTELDADREIIVFCHSGVRSMRVTAFLMARGLDRVRNMKGGIDAWSATVDPGVPRY